MATVKKNDKLIKEGNVKFGEVLQGLFTKKHKKATSAKTKKSKSIRKPT